MRKFKLWFISILILLIFDVIIAILYSPYCEKQIKKFECLENNGVIVVFFGDSEKNNDLGPMQISRLKHALKIYHSNAHNAIICVGGNRPNKNFYGSKKSKEYLINHGINPQKIYIDTISYDTRSNLREFYKISAKAGFLKFIYVSDAIHLFRIADWSIEKNFCLSLSDYNFSFLQKIQYANYQWLAYFMKFMFTENQYDYLIRQFRNITS